MSEMYPLRDWDNNIIGYTGYKGSDSYYGYTGNYTGYTGAADYNYIPQNVLKGYSVGDEILLYNEKTKKERKYIVKKKHPWFLAIKKKGWFIFKTRIIYRNNIFKVGHLLIEK